MKLLYLILPLLLTNGLKFNKFSSSFQENISLATPCS